MPRLTRKEKQAHTKRCLMAAAAQVFTRKGMEQGSIDEVAETAGFTKGAFYANFKNKEELFLAMLDERFAARLAEIEGAIEQGGTIEEEARRAGADFTRYVSSDPSWQRMFIEFAAYAARNEDFRAELVTRLRTLEARIAEALEHGREQAGLSDLEPPVPITDIARMGRIMANGYAIECLLFGEEIDPDLYPAMLAMFFAGVRASAVDRQPA
jgi:AcrR family transcriptional regulator